MDEPCRDICSERRVLGANEMNELKPEFPSIERVARFNAPGRFAVVLMDDKGKGGAKKAKRGSMELICVGYFIVAIADEGGVVERGVCSSNEHVRFIEIVVFDFKTEVRSNPARIVGGEMGM